VNDIRTSTTLVCAILALAIAISIRVPRRLRPVDRAFFVLAIDISAWYFWQSIFVLSEPVSGTLSWSALLRVGAGLAVALPYLALRLFEAMASREPTPRSRRLERALGLATVFSFGVGCVLGPNDVRVRIFLFLHVTGSLAAVLFSFYAQGQRSPLGLVRQRASYPYILGAVACIMTVVDFANFVWEPSTQAPPIGAMLSVAFLFALREALHVERLPGLWELFVRVIVAILLGIVMAGIFALLSRILGKLFDPTYLNAVLGITVCLLFDALRAQVEARTQWLHFIERSGLESAADLLQRRLLHILTIEEMSVIVMEALRTSRGLTGAGLFLRDPDDTGFDRIAEMGSRVASRIEVATARPLLERLTSGPLNLAEIEREVRVRRDEGLAPEAREEAALGAAAVLGGPRNTVVAGVRDAAGDLVGLLVVFDEQGGGALTADDILALGKIASHVGVVIENSRAYSEMKERDRLAVIGQMTAGLAHEIRNPLGSIKGAAQLLVRLGSDASSELDARKYLEIIVAEVDRLARVLDKVRDLAPNQPTVAPIDVNAVVRRTLQVFSAEPGHDDLDVRETLDPDLPRVVIDPEQLQQVLLNLLRNSAQATTGRGRIGVTTAVRVGRSSWWGAPRVHDGLIELRVTDNGPGISRKVIEKLFVPFFTTKREGTGLGLAISQKIVQEARGRIEVRSHEGAGTVVAVLLPAAMDALGTPTPRPAATSA
jgi:two-component system sensor histidine kinase HydH